MEHTPSENWNTRHSLILRAQKGEHEAWEEFVLYYERFIYYLLNRMNINIGDMDDMVQEILLTLWKKLEHYSKRNAKFRNWLSTVVRNTARNCLKQKIRYDNRQTAVAESLTVLESYSDSELERLIDEEWQVYLSNVVMEKLKSAFSQNSIDCFMMMNKGIPAEEIAEQLNLTTSSVYTFKKRVKSAMVRELKHLINHLEF